MVILFNMKYGGSMQTNKTVLFSSLCLGAKFRYINKEKIYVKIGHNPGEVVLLTGIILYNHQHGLDKVYIV